MKQITWTQLWKILNRYVLNKYVVSLVVFAVIFIFVGEQSMIKNMKRNQQIHETEDKIRAAERATQEASRKMKCLDQTDSLETYAREHYLMHKTNEDIFLVDEE